MTTTELSEVLAKKRAAQFVGRTRELAALLACLQDGGAIVTQVHGMAGVGKTSLLLRFQELAAGAGVLTVQVDGRHTEPTERGFLAELNAATGYEATSESDLSGAAQHLSALGQCVVLIADNYEHLYMLDTWIRQQFLPALSTNVRVVLAGRQPPSPGWQMAPEWQGLFASMPLSTLSDDESLDLLTRAGVRGESVHLIQQLARGHPLALRLAAGATSGSREVTQLESTAFHAVIQSLAWLHLSQIDDPSLREALEASSVVRRTTVPLLAALLPSSDAVVVYEGLRTLPFVEEVRDGLLLHAAVQDAIASSLRAADPDRYRSYRQAAWRELRSQFRRSGVTEMWRSTADMLYILDNPVVREVFFPGGIEAVSAEPMRSGDVSAIRQIARTHEPAAAAAILDAWLDQAPQVFRVVRSAAEPVSGFYMVFEPNAVDPRLIRSDPLMAAWQKHLRDNPVPPSQSVIYLRRWLSASRGELPSPAQGMAWLGSKQMYMAMRPQLRRCYITLGDLDTYADVAKRLDFQYVGSVDFEGVAQHLTYVDFGAGSIDAWITGHVAKELGLEQDGLLDVTSHELVLDGTRSQLTPLEFEFMRVLIARPGEALSRAQLMESVWGYDFSGESNVVETLVAGLRRKLKSDARLIETVWGVGYRFRQT